MSEIIVLVSPEKEIETYVDNIFQISKENGISKISRVNWRPIDFLIHSQMLVLSRKKAVEINPFWKISYVFYTCCVCITKIFRLYMKI